MTSDINQSSYQSSSDASAEIDDWLPLKAFCKKFHHIPEKTLKWQLTSRYRNGLSPYVQLIGKTRYISITGYARWLKEKTGGCTNDRH